VALIPVDDALALVLADAEPLAWETVPVAEAHGRVLAQDLAARRTQPPSDISAMDGYAVRTADVASTPARLRLVGEVAAGRLLEGTIGPGEAVRIFTGGVVPAGADTIVVQENTRREGDRVVVESPSPSGRHIRPAGLDFRAGDVLLRKGRQLTVRDIALAASMDHPAIPAHRRPRVAMLSTGDELVPPGSGTAPGQIVSSNGLSLTALARAEGAEARDFGIVPDDLQATVAAIRHVRGWPADVLVTTGGASVGDYDLVQGALSGEGLELSFWKVALRPGKPLMYGRLGETRVLGLPGNPVSASVCAILFLLPLIRRFSGRVDTALPLESASLGRDLARNDERQDYLRATLRAESDGTLVATPLGVQDSSMMSGLAKADCLLVRRPFAPEAKAGETCSILRLPL
jgi:molybdopterin molybdotransferase